MAHENEDAEIERLIQAGGGMNKGEHRVVERLRRAQFVARVVAPDEAPRLKDLLELAEMIEDEGG